MLSTTTKETTLTDRPSTVSQMEKTQSQLKDMLELFSNSNQNNNNDNNMNNEDIKSNYSHSLKQKLQEQKMELYKEASTMTKKLYKSCLRSVQRMRPGNEHDEVEFQRREESSKTSLKFEPPVDRTNELDSRANYYTEYVREGFFQESDCLPPPLKDQDGKESVEHVWSMEHVDRYVHLLRSGEEHRKWVLNEYKFDIEDDAKIKIDEGFDEERLDDFERRARQLVTDGYREKGWLVDYSEEEKGKIEQMMEEDKEFWKEEDEEIQEEFKK